MTQIQLFHQLAAHYYAAQIGTDVPLATTMFPFLAVPIKERLVLLCLSEQATMPQIKAALPYAKETDVRQTSHRMRAAIGIFNEAMENPTAWLHPGPYPLAEVPDLLERHPETGELPPFPLPDRLIPRDTDKQLRQAFFPEAAVLLFGELVPEPLAALGLQVRAVLYLIAVEEYGWKDVQTLLQCTEWSVRQALKGGIEALGG